MKLNVSVTLQHSWKKSLHVKMKPSQFVSKLYCVTKQNIKKNQNLCNVTTTLAMLKNTYFTITSFLCCINIELYGYLLFL